MLKKTYLVVLFLVLPLFLLGCKKTTLILINNNSLKVEIVNTLEKMQKGLMFRKSLPENEGMFFILPEVRHSSLWMKNTTIPLSAAFVSEDRIITEVIDLKSLDETPRFSKKEIKYVIEVNQGWFEKNKIKVGDKVEINIK